MHPPTVYFPLLVDEAMMVEPTETEARETLDAFATALEAIIAEAEQDPEIARNAPYTTPVRRLDEVAANRNPVDPPGPVAERLRSTEGLLERPHGPAAAARSAVGGARPRGGTAGPGPARLQLLGALAEQRHQLGVGWNGSAIACLLDRDAARNSVADQRHQQLAGRLAGGVALAPAAGSARSSAGRRGGW